MSSSRIAGTWSPRLEYYCGRCKEASRYKKVESSKAKSLKVSKGNGRGEKKSSTKERFQKGQDREESQPTKRRL